ncbi:hypothetical protein TSOC_000305, partial [Tetrabaena socialis]
MGSSVVLQSTFMVQSTYSDLLILHGAIVFFLQ